MRSRRVNKERLSALAEKCKGYADHRKCMLGNLYNMAFIIVHTEEEYRSVEHELVTNGIMWIDGSALFPGEDSSGHFWRAKNFPSAIQIELVEGPEDHPALALTLWAGSERHVGAEGIKELLLTIERSTSVLGGQAFGNATAEIFTHRADNFIKGD